MGRCGADEISVVYASDDNFVKVLGVSITSLFENNKGECIGIYVLADGILDYNKTTLENIARKYSQKITFVDDVDVDVFGCVELNALTWSKATFARMFIGAILKDFNLKRVLYLDCDTIVCCNIRELWEYDLKEHCIGAVLDAISPLHKKNIGIKRNQPYVNAGVLLIDLDGWNETQAEKKLVNFAKKYNGKVPYADQGIINGALVSMICILPLKWNVNTVFVDFDLREIEVYRKPSGVMYSEREISEARNNPGIIHFTKSIFTIRPWYQNSNHKLKEYWIKYRNMTVWGESVLPRYDAGIKTKIYTGLVGLLPRYLMLQINGIAHSVIKPIMDKL